ncbi:MAG TPA: hypothetical protein VLE69_01890 [Candidatus Saccharimonadales bacterium]|nr:hypothetical protein [Candidatus Saccharimonadales bacterium]
MKKNLFQPHQESGLVSIIVTVFVLLVVTLIVLGFAKTIRREQRQVLDRQLSTQAFYAAESGVNDAVSVLKNNPTATKSTCGPDATFTASGSLDPGGNTAYTCLLVTPTNLTSLTYDTIDTEKSTVIPINTSANLATLNISWEANAAQSNYACTTAAGTFPPAAPTAPLSDCDAGVLRIDLTPTPTTGFTRTSLVDNTLTAFLYPKGGGTNIPTTLPYAGNIGNTSGVVFAASCNALSSPRRCQVNITMPNNSANYYLRVRSIYKQNGLTISANSGAATFSGAQTQIDSTGKANDVLRRISVRVDSSSISSFPDFAIQSRDSICKRFTAAVGIAPTTDQGLISDTTNPCALN